MQPVNDVVLVDVAISLSGNNLTVSRAKDAAVEIKLEQSQAAQLRGALRLLAPPGSPELEKPSASGVRVRVLNEAIEISKLDVKITLQISELLEDGRGAVQALMAMPRDPLRDGTSLFDEYLFHRSCGSTAIGFFEHLSAKRKYAAVFESGIKNLEGNDSPAYRKRISLLKNNIRLAHIEETLNSVTQMYNKWAQCALDSTAPKNSVLTWGGTPLDIECDDYNKPTSDLNEFSLRMDSTITLSSEEIASAYLSTVEQTIRRYPECLDADAVHRRALTAILRGEFFLTILPALEDWEILRVPNVEGLHAFSSVVGSQWASEFELVNVPEAWELKLEAEHRWHSTFGDASKPPAEKKLLRWAIDLKKERNAEAYANAQRVGARVPAKSLSQDVVLESPAKLYQRAKEEQTLSRPDVQLLVAEGLKKQYFYLDAEGIIKELETRVAKDRSVVEVHLDHGFKEESTKQVRDTLEMREYFLKCFRAFGVN